MSSGVSIADCTVSWSSVDWSYMTNRVRPIRASWRPKQQTGQSSARLTRFLAVSWQLLFGFHTASCFKQEGLLALFILRLAFAVLRYVHPAARLSNKAPSS